MDFRPLWVTITIFLISCASILSGESVIATENMTIDELRNYQAYFYPTGGRDPLNMRLPTSEELGEGKTRGSRAPTLEQMEFALESTLAMVNDAIREGRFEDAMIHAEETINLVENEWPPFKPEQTQLIQMFEEIISLHSLATRLKYERDITQDFEGLALRVNGIAWSPIDSKAIINGRLRSAGELLLEERQQGDLRIEDIDEYSVIFQFMGKRFRVPVELHSK